MKRFNVNFFITVLATQIFASCNKQVTEIDVRLRQMQIPVLKLKQNNPLLQIRVSLAEDKVSTIDVTSFYFTFKGTTDLKDIKAVRLYYFGKDSIWNKKVNTFQLGREMIPSFHILIKGSRILEPGDNFFMLTCELADNANLQDKIYAGCLRINFSGKTLVKTEIASPSLKQRIGVAVRQHLDDKIDTYRIPGLATTNKGTLLAIYDTRRDSPRDLQGDIDIGISRSIDGGNTWEPMRLVLDMGEWGGLPQKFNGVADACILTDKNSENIFIAGCWMHGVLDKNGKWIKGLTEESKVWEHQWIDKGSQPGFDPKQTSQFIITKSTDDGKTWSKPVNLTQMLKQKEWWLFVPAPGHGITLSDGKVVFPTQGRDSRGESFSNITFSNNGGKTWQTSKPATTNTTECMAVQLNDGSIMLNMRDNKNRIDDSEKNGRAIFITEDLGETWTEHPTSHGALIESTCMASLHKHFYTDNEGNGKNVLLFSNPNTKKGRHHMTIKVSFDEGKTWPEKYWLLLDEGNSRGYSCLTSVNENTIGILYEGSQADITFQRIPLSELLNPDSNK